MCRLLHSPAQDTTVEKSGEVGGSEWSDREGEESKRQGEVLSDRWCASKTGSKCLSLAVVGASGLIIGLPLSH